MKERLLRVISLIFAVGVLIALTVHAGVTVGCRTTKPAFSEPPRATPAPPHAHDRLAHGEGVSRPRRLPLAQPRFLPATKAGPMWLPRRPRNQQASPPVMQQSLGRASRHNVSQQRSR